jgi:hypothetical protein
MESCHGLTTPELSIRSHINCHRWHPDHYVKHSATQKPVGPPYFSGLFASFTPSNALPDMEFHSVLQPTVPHSLLMPKILFYLGVLFMLLLSLLQSDHPTTDSAAHNIPTHNRLFDCQISSMANPPLELTQHLKRNSHAFGHMRTQMCAQFHA